MPFPFDMDRMLVGAPPNTPLRVVHILFDSNRRRCDERGIHEGDQLTRLDSLGEDLVVETREHERARLDFALALCVEVEPLPVAAEPPRRPAWRSERMRLGVPSEGRAPTPAS